MCAPRRIILEETELPGKQARMYPCGTSSRDATVVEYGEEESMAGYRLATDSISSSDSNDLFCIVRGLETDHGMKSPWSHTNADVLFLSKGDDTNFEDPFAAGSVLDSRIDHGLNVKFVTDRDAPAGNENDRWGLCGWLSIGCPSDSSQTPVPAGYQYQAVMFSDTSPSIFDRLSEYESDPRRQPIWSSVGSHLTFSRTPEPYGFTPVIKNQTSYPVGSE
jgi:hypothetical protein